MVTKHESTAVRQKQILDAAREVIFRYGSEHVTVKRIARETGITETAVYRHFESKKSILSLLVDQIESNLVEDITAQATIAGNKPLDILGNVLRSHLSAVERRQGISFLIIAEIISFGDKELNAKVSGTIERYISCLANLLAEGARSGQVRADLDCNAAATALFGIIQGAVSMWALNDFSFDLQEKYAPLWSVFRKSITAKNAD